MVGELSNRSQIALPMVAAVCGMAVPSFIYSVINWGDPIAMRGWAIPAATDIAFALGVLMLLGSRVPVALKIFLTAVAILDDMGAIVVIAIFYTENLSLLMLGASLAGVALLFALNRAGVVIVVPYVLVGIAIWVFVLKSGVHATLAGVVTALAIPLRGKEGDSPLLRMEHALHPWVAFGILPAFAFLNAGVSLEGITMSTLLDPVSLGIALGLFLGKALGIFIGPMVLIRLGLARLPDGATWLQFFGLSVLCGIGFTMSLFIGALAFEGQSAVLERATKLGVLLGSITATLVGSLILVLAARKSR
jgi:NhaA family Na+:H+ antiporter